MDFPVKIITRVVNRIRRVLRNIVVEKIKRNVEGKELITKNTIRDVFAVTEGNSLSLIEIHIVLINEVYMNSLKKGNVDMIIRNYGSIMPSHIAYPISHLRNVSFILMKIIILRPKQTKEVPLKIIFKQR